MTRLRPIVFLILVFALQCLQIASAKAQSGEPPDNSPDDTGLWLAIFGRGDISHEALSEQSRWWFDGHMRLFDDSNGFGQSIVRPGIGYAVNEQTTVWAGYGWIRTAPPAGPGEESGAGSDTDEHRLWQQLTWSQKLEPVTVGLRSRLEERFLESESETAWRFRQLPSWRQALRTAPELSLVL